MKAFVVSLNGRNICTAGVGPEGVLTTSVYWVGGGPRPDAHGDLRMHVGGLDSRTDEHVDWPVPELAVGDEVTIRIIEVERVDPEGGRRKARREPGGGG
jgi:hypothetical protein